MTRILVIEPETQSRHALRHMLERAGYEVEVAIDGAGGAKAHSSRPADLVIADMEGVPQPAAFAGARVLAVPSSLIHRSQEMADQLCAMNAQHMLPKPFRRDDLLAAVKVTLGRPMGLGE